MKCLLPVVVILVLHMRVCVYGKRRRQSAPLDVALLDGESTTSEVTPPKIPTLPDVLEVNVTLMNRQVPIPLKLKRNKLMDKNKNMFVLRLVDGKPALMRVNVGFESNIGYYQDLQNEASVKVTCEGLDEGICHPILTGSIGEYDIEPLRLEDLTTTSVRRRRQATNITEVATMTTPTIDVKARKRPNQNRQNRKNEKQEKKAEKQRKREERRKRKLYAVFKRRTRRMNRKDSEERKEKRKPRRKVNGKVQLEPDSPVLQGAGMLQVVPEINADQSRVEILGRNLVNSKTRAAAMTDTGANTINAKDVYNVEILAVIDYQTYSRFLEDQNAKTNDQRVDNTYKDIREYFSQVVNGIDLRYRAINSQIYHIRVALANFLILDNPNYPNWDSHKSKDVITDVTGDTRHTLAVESALRKISDWRSDMLGINQLPEHDHLMLFTDHDLTSAGDTSTSGYAYVGELCSPFSVSLVEDHGLYDSILTAAHELGHSLGADHDGENNVCISSDSYIMADVSGNTSPNTIYNPYIFSTCSKDAFKKYLDSLMPPGSGTSNDNCLLDEALIYDENEFNMAIGTPPGQLLNPNQQCQERLGSSSYYGWGGNLGAYSDICTQMACKSQASEFSYKIYTALPGTTCGDRMWCFEGRCVPVQGAPAADSTCVHGDSLLLFDNNETCAQAISAYPAYCAQEYYADLCCQSCARARSGDPDCPFGDQSTQCFGVNDAPNLCYNTDNFNLCCESCGKLKTGIQGCEFGDKQENCDAQFCNTPGNEQYTENCCYTCGRVNVGGNAGTGAGTGSETTTTTTTTTTTMVPTTTTTKQTTTTPTTPKTTTQTTTTTTPTTTTPTTPKTTTQTTTTTTTTTPTTTTTTTVPTTTTTTQPTTRTTKQPITTNPRGQETTTLDSQTGGATVTSVPGAITGGSQALCLKANARYGFLPCSILALVIPQVCSNERYRQDCCDECSGCSDKASCMLRYSEECYDPIVQNECCSSCSKYKTNKPGCMYGDKNRACSRYARRYPTYVCTEYADICCQTCERTDVTTARQVSRRTTQNINRAFAGSGDLSEKPLVDPDQAVTPASPGPSTTTQRQKETPQQKRERKRLERERKRLERERKRQERLQRRHNRERGRGRGRNQRQRERERRS